MNTAFVQPAEREQVLKLAAVGGLRAFAFLVKPFEDFVSLAPAVLFAGAKLRRQAQVLGLLLRADANVITAPTMIGSVDPFAGSGKLRLRGTVATRKLGAAPGISRPRCKPSSLRAGGWSRRPDRSSIPRPHRAVHDSARSGSAPSCSARWRYSMALPLNSSRDDSSLAGWRALARRCGDRCGARPHAEPARRVPRSCGAQLRAARTDRGASRSPAQN